MAKKIIQLSRPKVFNIETYKLWDITEENHRRKLICTSPKGDSIEFSIDIKRESFAPEFSCIYRNKDGQGCVLYRAKPNDHVQKFWIDLGSEYFKRTSGNQDFIRDKFLKEFDFNWEG